MKNCAQNHNSDTLEPVLPTEEAIQRAKKEMQEENILSWGRANSPSNRRTIEENHRRSSLPSEHPDHICGIMCDGQDGSNSDCARLRRKLFG